MIYERIVDFDTVQRSLFKQKNEKAWFPIRFFRVFGLAVLIRASIFILFYNIMPIMYLPPLLAAFFILWAAYSPCAGGAQSLLRWYRSLWYWYLSDRECPPALQCPFQFHRTHGRTSDAGYAETPFQDWHSPPRITPSFPARCSCGLSACPCGSQKSYRF